MSKLIAELRDQWFKSLEGIRCADPGSLSGDINSRRIYLKNRLECAFLAGVKAAESIQQPQEQGDD